MCIFFATTRASQRICSTTLPGSSRRQGLPGEREMVYAWKQSACSPGREEKQGLGSETWSYTTVACTWEGAFEAKTQKGDLTGEHEFANHGLGFSCTTPYSQTNPTWIATVHPEVARRFPLFYLLQDICIHDIHMYMHAYTHTHIYIYIQSIYLFRYLYLI